MISSVDFDQRAAHSYKNGTLRNVTGGVEFGRIL